jgi:hypothetical protein
MAAQGKLSNIKLITVEKPTDSTLPLPKTHRLNTTTTTVHRFNTTTTKNPQTRHYHYEKPTDSKLPLPKTHRLNTTTTKAHYMTKSDYNIKLQIHILKISLHKINLKVSGTSRRGFQEGVRFAT